MTFTKPELDRFRSLVRAIPEGELGFWDRLVVTPPILVRLLARTGRYPRVMTDSEIAIAGQVTKAEVMQFSWSLTWDLIPLNRACAYLRGCAMDITDCATWNRTRQYIGRRRPRWDHLKRSPDWPYFEPMKRAWEHAVDYAAA